VDALTEDFWRKHAPACIASIKSVNDGKPVASQSGAQELLYAFVVVRHAADSSVNVERDAPARARARLCDQDNLRVTSRPRQGRISTLGKGRPAMLLMMVSKEPIPEQHRRAVAARTSTDPAEASEAPIPKITMLPRSANNTASYWPAGFGVTQATARNRQSTGSFPPADKIGRERLYRIDEVDAWIKRQRVSRCPRERRSRCALPLADASPRTDPRDTAILWRLLNGRGAVVGLGKPLYA